MLNSVSEPVRRRLSADDRRRQLVGIGLRRIVDTPIQDLSLDQVAAEAGISRGLLFHYFPTKTDFYLACIAAAGRRILRNTAPAAGDAGPVQVRTMVTAMIEQIDRRRVVLPHARPRQRRRRPAREPRSTSPSARSPPTGWSRRSASTPAARRSSTPGGRTSRTGRSRWSADPRRTRGRTSLEALVAHCERALAALCAQGA